RTYIGVRRRAGSPSFLATPGARRPTQRRKVGRAVARQGEFLLHTTWGRTHPHLGIAVWTTRRCCGRRVDVYKPSTGCRSCPRGYPRVDPHPTRPAYLGKRQLPTQSTALTVSAVFSSLKRKKK